MKIIIGLTCIPFSFIILTFSGQLGHTESSIFGSSIPITGLVADQQASLFGHCCFNPGDTKLTLGTGSFFNVNIGAKPLALITGMSAYSNSIILRGF